MSANKSRRELPPFTAIPKQFKQLLEDGRLRLQDIGLWFILDSFTDNNTKECYPSLATLAELCHVSKNSVRSSIARLVDCGCLKVEKRRMGQSGHDTNLYTLIYFLPNMGGSKSEPCGSKFDTGGSKNELEVVQNLNKGGSKSDTELITHITNNSIELRREDFQELDDEPYLTEKGKQFQQFYKRKKERLAQATTKQERAKINKEMVYGSGV